MQETNNYLFESLNKAQHQAVAHFNGPLLVIAGAGSASLNKIGSTSGNT